MDDDFKEMAEQELLQRFYINESNFFEFDDVDTRLKKINDSLLVPSDYYIQLVCHKDYDVFPKYVYYCRDGFRHICKQPRERLISYMCDEKYSYIYDYMDSVVCYRLEKDNLEVSLEEMIKLAEKFAAEYKQDNKILKKNL